MKTCRVLFIITFIAFGLGFVSSCQEEDVKPATDGNVTKNDDWEKQNV